jgi:hypothetical protein
MLEILKIKLLGHQPVAKVTDKILDDLLKREFGNQADTVRNKLNKVVSDTHLGKNRISAAIIRLSNKDINTVDHYLSVANTDCRDVLSQAEYPRCSKLGFSEMGERDMKPIYLADWKAYSDWLNS